jgi:hypothetical protein
MQMLFIAVLVRQIDSAFKHMGANAARFTNNSALAVGLDQNNAPARLRLAVSRDPIDADASLLELLRHPVRLTVGASSGD